jgi:tetratricopeptide (TPR) repeat protein
MGGSGLGWAAALALLLGLACTPVEERLEQARQAVETALERGDREAALEAVRDLRAALPPTPGSFLELGSLLARSGGAPEAAWLLEEGVRRHPERDDLRLALAEIALLLGNPSLARETVAPIAPGAGQHAAALVARARAELSLGNLEAALDVLKEAEQLYPDQLEVRLARISTLLGEGRQEEARAAIAEARAGLVPGDEAAAALRRLDVTLAQIQAQQGDPDAAIALLDRMVRERPDDLLAWGVLVQVLVQQQRAKDALARLEAGRSADDAPEALYPLIALAHAALGDDAEAETALRTYASASSSAAAVLPLVDLLSDRGDAEAVTAVLDGALVRFPEDARLRVLRTEALLATDRVADARAEFTRFRDATFAGDPQLDYLRARLDLASGEARAAADRLTDLAPRLDTAATHYWLARALDAMGDSVGARRRYALAEQRDPTWAEPSAALVSLEQRRGSWRAMADAARTMVRRAPRRFEGWRSLADALAQLGDGNAAEQIAREALERFPERTEARVVLARALRTQRRYDEALAALDLGGAGGRDRLALLDAERVLTLGMAGRVEAGLALAREALTRDADAAELHAALASLCFAAGAAAEGSGATDRALALAPEEPRPLRVRCEFRASRADWVDARADCERYLGARPEDAGAHFMLGVVLQALGDSRRAAEAYRRAAALDEYDARPRNNLAGLLAADGDLDGALAAAQEAYRLDERNPQVMDTLGVLYLRKGLAERAASLLDEAHAAVPDQRETALHLALAFAETGRASEARSLLEGLRRREVTDDPHFRVRVDEALRSLP